MIAFLTIHRLHMVCKCNNFNAASRKERDRAWVELSRARERRSSGTGCLTYQSGKVSGTRRTFHLAERDGYYGYSLAYTCPKNRCSLRTLLLAVAFVALAIVATMNAE